MRCAEWEERIALWAGGDLAEEAAEVERHLRVCPACGVFAEELRESLEMMRGAHAAEIPAAAYTVVRACVLERLARPWWKRAWVYAAAVIILIIAAGIGLTRRSTRPAPMAAVHANVRSPVSAEVPPDYRSLTVAAPKSVQRRVPKQAYRSHREKETVLVKIETGNPDVVIYWIAETKGEE